VDTVDTETRSKIMSKIHQPTKLEETVRRWLESEGIPHEMYPKVEGRPDIVLGNGSNPVYVFVDGCFWHCCPLHYRRPKSRQEFWIPHVEGSNDRREKQRERLPYRWMRIWEHDVKTGTFMVLLREAISTTGSNALLQRRLCADPPR
jgi:DNA mismatch endonuclease (patch repair protein)